MNQQQETPEQIKAERDAMKWFIESLDERIIVRKGIKQHEILRYIKAHLFDTNIILKSIRDGNSII